MCFDEDAVPPIPVNRDAAIETTDLVLTASDGNRFGAVHAVPADGSDVAIVIHPDVRGLFGFYIELAKRFAENGVNALVFDYYGRTAGIGKRGKDFPGADHMSRMAPSAFYTDLEACVRYLRSPEGGGARSVLTVGFCIGGRIAVLAAAGGHDLAGVIGFYCWPGLGPGGRPGPTARAGELRSPVLALMAGDDPGIPQEHVDEFDGALAAAGVDHEVITYPGTPHSFFDAKRSEYADASLDAWQRMLSFIERVGSTAIAST